jgi:phosphinothricin acetyltransferase
MKVDFKYAEFSDLPHIVNIYNASIPGRLATADLEPVTVASKENWFHSHNQKNRPLWLVMADEKIAGWLSFNSFYGRPAYENTIELSIYLDHKFQGKGLGNICLKFALEEAKSRKIKNVLGFIFGHNQASLHLFYKFKFELWGNLPKIAEMDDTERDLIILGKRIN